MEEKEIKEKKEIKPTEQGPRVVRSTLKNFSKKEFIVLKHNVFTIQSITPKKLVLRIKGQNPKLPDGIYGVLNE